jgi:dihydrofolate synthase/folylpolyglutamate synthase
MAGSALLARPLENLYQRIPLGMRLGLEPMRAACERVGHPELGFKAVHVAGTNGKGSVCAMVESIARAQGLRTGLYTSPHLCRFAERIRIDGEPISDPQLADLLERALREAPDLSFFEAATLTAFLAFRQASVDVGILEVGLGGRLDATNVLPRVSAAAITRIALDHADRLGPTLVDIAREKAGIAKPGVDLLLGPMDPDVRAAIDHVAHQHGATTSSIDDIVAPTRIGLDGQHQIDNARIAAVLGRRLGTSPEAIAGGLAAVRWPGRLERIGRHLLDCAHNPDGTQALARHVRTLGVPPERVKLVFGALTDKDWQGMLADLAPLAESRVFVSPRAGARPAVQPQAMAALWKGEAPESSDRGLERAIEPAGAELVIVAGSIVLVGQARALLLGLPIDPPVAL